ncbi:hypothetical protein MNBD_ALPHA11-1043 [hydrothermal vent metagenome]|uniref:Uncharacterized protein n=1 Tax=hydrothermal vent metagenome TaxID=652676 RepID=A0A3B0TKC0_9ZZZZ
MRLLFLSVFLSFDRIELAGSFMPAQINRQQNWWTNWSSR